MENKDIFTDLRSLVNKYGTQAEAAKYLGVSSSFFNDLLKGRRIISDKIAHKLGYEWRLVRLNDQNA